MAEGTRKGDSLSAFDRHSPLRRLLGVGKVPAQAADVHDGAMCFTISNNLGEVHLVVYDGGKVGYRWLRSCSESLPLGDTVRGAPDLVFVVV